MRLEDPAGVLSWTDKICSVPFWKWDPIPDSELYSMLSGLISLFPFPEKGEFFLVHRSRSLVSAVCSALGQWLQSCEHRWYLGGCWRNLVSWFSHSRCPALLPDSGSSRVSFRVYSLSLSGAIFSHSWGFGFPGTRACPNVGGPVWPNHLESLAVQPEPQDAQFLCHLNSAYWSKGYVPARKELDTLLSFSLCCRKGGAS